MNATWKGGELFLYERVGGVVTRRIERAEHSCFVRRADLGPELERELRGSRHVRSVRAEGEWVRVVWVNRDAAIRASTEFLPKSRKVTAYEGDVDPVSRWLQESDAPLAPPRRCYLDIETDSRVPFSRKEEMRVLCWAVCDDDGRTPGYMGVLAEDSDEAELALLEGLWRELSRYDQVVAWNGERFDFPVVLARSQAMGVRGVDPRRFIYLDYMVAFERLNVHAAESGAEKQSMALDSICREVLGVGKLEGIDPNRTWEHWVAGGEERQRLARYCARDTALMPRLEAETGYLALLQTIADASRIFPSTRAVGAKAQVEGFLLHLGRRRGQRAPSRDPGAKREEREQFKGAFVLEAKTGVHRNVHVCDFSRMYPSIILSWNLSPESYRPLIRSRETALDRPSYLSHLPDRDLPVPEGHAVVPGVDRVFDLRTEALLPTAVAEVLRLRAAWDEKKREFPPRSREWTECDRRSQAYKIAANSFFGVVGSQFSRYCVTEVASSITAIGAWLLRHTVEEAERRGWKAIGGDTDSLFIRGTSVEEFQAFVNYCNSDLYPRLLREQRCEQNYVKLAYEKAFATIVVTRKKRYAGRYLHWKGTPATADSKPEIKGLEYKRGDGVRLAWGLQLLAVDAILGMPEGGEAEAAARVREAALALKHQVLDEPLAQGDYVVTKHLGKPLGAYVVRAKKDGTRAAQPPHVEVARVLSKRGRDVGEGAQISYVVVDGSCSPMKVVPAEDISPDGLQPDRYYLWEDLVWPPTQRLAEVAFPSEDWSAVERARPPKVRAQRAAAPAPAGARPRRARAAPQAQGALFGDGTGD